MYFCNECTINTQMIMMMKWSVKWNSPGVERTGWEVERVKSGAWALPWSCWSSTAVRRRTTALPSVCCSPACCRLRRDLAARPTSPTRRRRAAAARRSHLGRCSRRRRRRLRRGRRRRAPAESGRAADGTARRRGSRLGRLEVRSRRDCGDESARRRRRPTRTRTRGRHTSRSAEVAAQGRTAAVGYDISVNSANTTTKLQA